MMGLIAAVWAASFPTRAWAAGGGSGRSIEFVLLIIAVVAIAYLVAHLALERIADRFGVVSGVEYIVVGAVIFQVILPDIAPAALDFQHANGKVSIDHVFARLRPVLVLGTGALGLLIGLQMRITRWSELKDSALRTALVVSLVTAGSVVGLPALLLALLAPDFVLFNALPLLLCAGAVAMVAADAPIRSLAAFLGASGPATGLATRTARFCSSIAVIFFGLIFCFYHVGEIVPFDTARWLQWLIIHLVLGAVLGRIFDAFLQQDYSDDKVLTIAIGMVIFASGLAYGLQLSPVFVNFIMGLSLSALGKNAERARRMLLRIKHPLYIALFIFAGARLDISVPMLTYSLVVPYLVFRIGGRVVGGWFSTAPSTLQPRTPGMGRILLSPGALSIAIALDFLMIPISGDDPAGGVKHTGVVEFPGFNVGAQELYSMLIVAILVSEVIAYTWGRTWLIDAADVSPAAEDDPSGGDREED